MSALSKGDFGKMKSSLDNLKTVTGLSATKDKKHEDQLKTDATAERSDRRKKIEADELVESGKRVEKKRVSGVKLKVNDYKLDDVTIDKKATDPKKKK
jgi:hypothetical protein